MSVFIPSLYKTQGIVEYEIPPSGHGSDSGQHTKRGNHHFFGNCLFRFVARPGIEPGTS